MSTETTVPQKYSDITPEWLTSALGSDAPVKSLTLEPIGKGSGFVGTLYRCRLQYETPDAEPTTVIVKMPTTDGRRRELFTRFGLYEREVGFYSRLQSETPVPTPGCYHAALDRETGDFVLLLEDMGDAIAGNPLVGATAERCRSALDIASRMHLRWWDDGAIGEHDWMVGANAPRMQAVIATEYDAAWQAFESQFGQHLPDALRKLGATLRTHLPQVLDHLSTPPVTLVHGDFQPANIFYRPDGTIAAIGDWQVVVRARGAMDVAYFMVNGVNPQDRRAMERDLLHDYHVSLLAGGVRRYSPSQLWADYRLAVLSQFGLVVVLSHVLGGDAHGTDDPEAAALAAVAGGRLIEAMSDLRPWELLESPPLWKRVAAVARRSLSRS